MRSQDSFPQHKGGRWASGLGCWRASGKDVTLWLEVDKGGFVKRKVEQGLEGGQHRRKPEEKGGMRFSMR